MAFWQDYWKSLKPLEVEEPIDVWVHRPLAYLLSKALYPTPISPNLVTVISIIWGLVASVYMFVDTPWHLQIAGVSLFLSAVFDCADGQLARMRGTSSVLGRMLDGAADLVVSSVSVVGGTYLVWKATHASPLQDAIVIALCVVTIVTGSLHTSNYDHYKNIFLRMTHPKYGEGEDYELALERYRATAANASLAIRLVWPLYLLYIKRQRDYVERFDPYTKVRFAPLPPFNEADAALYREHAGPAMRLWRNWFGFGSLVFGMSVSIALGVVHYYMLFRLVALNAVFYGYLRAKQRLASRRAFEALGY
ncbi:MAG: CDP-alcohol phosphatidyltransferase family protein [Polyangiaceae bacterium]